MSTDSTPGAAYDPASALGSLGIQPLVMTGIIVQLLRQHFADNSNIADDNLRQFTTGQLGNFVWTADADSGLLIESATKFDPNNTEKRPAIFVKRNSWQPIRLGINDQLLGNGTMDGHRIFHRLILGSHTIFAISTQPAEVEKLGYEVALMFLSFCPVLRENLNLHRIAVAEIGGIGKIKEATDRYAVPINLSYAFEQTWQLRQHAPYLKRIIMQTLE